MSFVTVQDIEYHKKFFRSECFLWGASEIRARRFHILQDFLQIVERKTPRDRGDPNEIDSVFSMESEGGVRRRLVWSVFILAEPLSSADSAAVSASALFV